MTTMESHEDRTDENVTLTLDWRHPLVVIVLAAVTALVVFVVASAIWHVGPFARPTVSGYDRCVERMTVQFRDTYGFTSGAEQQAIRYCQGTLGY
jgi:hypothetical protein